VLLHSSHDGIIACNPVNGKCRVLASGNWGWIQNRWNIGGIRRILFLEHFFDVESATMRPVPFDHREGFDLSRDQQTFAYAINSGSEAPEKFTTQIHVYAIDSGADDLVATLPGGARWLCFSPSGNRIAIGRKGDQVAIVQSKKLIQNFTGWDFQGWASETELILSQDYESQEYEKKRIKLMAVGDIATGKIRQFYP
jgi:hypothetical protein